MDSANLYHNANAGVRVQSRPSSLYLNQRVPHNPLAPSLQYSRPPLHTKSSSQKISHSSSDSKILPPINSYSMSSIGGDGSPVVNGNSDGQVNNGGGSAGNSMPGSNAQTPLSVHTPVSTSSSTHTDPSAFSSQQQQAANGLGMAPYQQQNSMYSTAPPSATTPQSANGMNQAFAAVSSPFDQTYGRLYPTASPSSSIPPSQNAYATSMAPSQNAYASAEAYRQLQGQNGNLPRVNAAPAEQAFYQQQQQQQQQLRQQQQQLAMAQQQEGEPVHVVGQQGRRGVLPTAGDKPPPVGGAKFIVPPKDKEGRFPCPFCQKTYQHAKHLKRHNLRHTGDRPYTCKLCKDTFSRSDILKRHFQKCSIRRGVPSDTDHLEGSRAHQQRNNRLSLSQQLAASNITPDPQGYLGGAGGPPPQSSYQPPLMNGIQNFLQNQGQPQSFDAETMEAISNRSSRANSIMRPQGLESGQAVSGYQENFPPQSMAGLQAGTVSYALPPGSGAYPYGPVVTTSDANSGYKTAGGDSANVLFNGQHPGMMMNLSAQQAAAWGIQNGGQNGVQNGAQNSAQNGMQNGMQNAGGGYPSNGTASSQHSPT